MAAYHRVYDSHHLQAHAKNRDQPRNPTLGYYAMPPNTVAGGFLTATRCVIIMYRRVTVTNVVLAVLLKCYYSLNLRLDSPSVHRSFGYTRYKWF